MITHISIGNEKLECVMSDIIVADGIQLKAEVAINDDDEILIDDCKCTVHIAIAGNMCEIEGMCRPHLDYGGLSIATIECNEK